jgi:DNA-binding response OmpR family regulator
MAGVMIVEDDAALREMLRDALEKRKYTVITAADGREAWQNSGRQLLMLL